MFIEVKKNPQVYLQHNGMDNQYLAPVTSSFRINLGLIAEISTYSIKEKKIKKTLDGMDFEIPVGTHLIHLEMSYTHTSHKAGKGIANEHTINERFFYKLFFLSEAHDEYVRLRNILDRQTLA